MSPSPRLLNLLMLKKSAVLKAFVATVILGLIAGCSARNPTYQDYRLVAASPDGKVYGDLPETLGVFPVTVPGWLDKKTITWSDGGVRLQTAVNDHWGEPLPELLTQSMVQNLRRQLGTRSWISPGPWVRDKRPAMVVFADVQGITVVNHQLRMNVVWSLEGTGRKVIARRDKVYGLLMESGDFTQDFVQALSQVWGLVAMDIASSL